MESWANVQSGSDRLGLAISTPGATPSAHLPSSPIRLRTAVRAMFASLESQLSRSDCLVRGPCVTQKVKAPRIKNWEMIENIIMFFETASRLFRGKIVQINSFTKCLGKNDG
jgi:hypothetical protein